MSATLADRNRDLVHELFDRVINAHDLAPVERLYRPDYVQHNPAVPQGVSGLKLFLELLFAGFPDIRGNIVLSVGEADRVMVLVEWAGTHSGPFIGLAATGRSIQFRTAEIFRIEKGRFAEHWDVVDNLAMQLALGLVAPAKT